MPRFDGRRAAGAGALLLALAAPALAGLIFDEKDWVEGAVPPPPAFEPSRALPFEGAAYASLRYAVDPATLVIGKDGVVRYVVVVTSPDGNVTGLYEGIRCSAAQVKTYARSNAGTWTPTQNAEWQELFDNGATRHSLWLAKQGVCVGAAPQTTVREMVNALKGERRNY